MNQRFRVLVPVLLLVAFGAFTGCKKKTPAPPPAAIAPAVAPAPTAQITATPTVITAGDQVVLTWKTTDATTASIDGLGDVPTSGTKTVSPASSTTYRLAARGQGGSADSAARVTVNQPPAVAVAPPSAMSAEEEFKANIQDVFFAYDKSDISSEAQSTLAHDANYLVSHPNVKFVIGGFCDERGSDEYNLALGQNRANATEKILTSAGVDVSRIRIISYGKEKPFCSDSNEGCWQQNRRAGFAMSH